MKILKTPTFSKQFKKLHDNQKKDFDRALTELVINPNMGDMKKGNLDGVYIYKFSMLKQLTLLAYEWHENEQQLILLSLGSHENFYRDLKG